MVFVNAFFALRYLGDAQADFKIEMNKLAYALMHNHFLPQAPRSPGASPASRADGECSPCADGVLHTLVSLKTFGHQTNGKGATQEKCNVCNRKCTYVCAGCSPNKFQLWSCCPPFTKVSNSDCNCDCNSDALSARTATVRARAPRVAVRALSASPAHSSPRDSIAARSSSTIASRSTSWTLTLSRAARDAGRSARGSRAWRIRRSSVTTRTKARTTTTTTTTPSDHER